MEYRFKKIRRGISLSDKCYLALIDYIEHSEVGKNKMPSEEDLADMLGVSRTTVREALQQLVAEGLLTRIPGQGHYAHRSVSKLNNRMDLYPDIYRLLDKYYGNATLEISEILILPPSDECKKRFERDGQEVNEVYSTRWTYSANGSPKFVGMLEFPVQHIKKPMDNLESIRGLPDFSSRYMDNVITHCTMILNVSSSREASLVFGPTDKCALNWTESIFNLDDLLVGFGKIYFKPDEIGLSLHASFSRDDL